MIPFYIVSVMWVLTLLFWQFREHQHAQAQMEQLKLFRSSSLAEYSADGKTQVKRQTNFVRPALEKAYSDKRWAEDGDDDD